MTSFVFADLCYHLHLIMVKNDNPTEWFPPRRKQFGERGVKIIKQFYFLGNLVLPHLCLAKTSYLGGLWIHEHALIFWVYGSSAIMSKEIALASCKTFRFFLSNFETLII